jgi:hypothetical protein
MIATFEKTFRLRRWWLPSVSVAIWLAFFLGVNLLPQHVQWINGDGDPCWHWRQGDWMIGHRAVIRADQFSHTRFGAPLVSKEWLSEVVFAAVGNAFGWPGFIALSGLLVATTLWLLHRRLLAEGNDLLVTTILVLLAAWACSVHWWARPHLVTHLLVAVFALRLRAFDRGAISPVKLAAWLVPLTALWVNLHGAFFAGFVLIGVYLIGNALTPGDVCRRKVAALALVLTGCLAASLLNPNGWKLHAHVAAFLRNPLLVQSTSENQSPNFHVKYLSGYVALLGVLGVTLVAARPRLRVTDMLLLGAWGYFSLHSVRNVPLFALVATPILAEHLTAWVQSAGDARWMRWWTRVSANVAATHRSADGRVWAAAAIVAIALAMRGQLLPAKILADRFPVAAVNDLKAHPDAVRGEMFNWYRWGGYVLWSWPERNVFVDGRNDFYGEELIREYQTVDDVKPGWENVLEKYNVGWTILPRQHPLNSLLALRKDWRLVRQDSVAAVYTRIAP